MPINLKSAYGDVYRITLDESAEIDGQSREDRVWLYQIPAKYGHIYPNGEATLGAYANGPRISAKLCALPFARVHQRGDTEATVVFSPEHLPEVAELLRARKRKVYSEAFKTAGAERLSRLRGEARLV